MKSKIARRILAETSIEVTEKVRLYGNKLIADSINNTVLNKAKVKVPLVY